MAHPIPEFDLMADISSHRLLNRHFVPKKPIALRFATQAIGAHIDHIRSIVSAQQTYARRGGLTEAVDIAELVDNAVAIHFTNTADVSIKRDYEKVAPVVLDRHKLL
jgi:hypothetical protein